MSKPAQHVDPSVQAVLHQAGKTWRALLATTRGGKVAFIEAREFRAEALRELEQWLDEHHAGSVLCVLPASAVICRNSPLPDAPPEQLEQALRLQAEAHLLGTTPAHRVGLAVLPAAPGETSRTGLIVAWPQSATFQPPRLRRPMQFVPDVAALAAILNGQRPPEALLWLDRADGSMALGVTHAAGAAFRCTREDAQRTEEWSRNIARAVAETALGVGHTGPFVDGLARQAQQDAASLSTGESGLFLPSDVMQQAGNRISGLKPQVDWWKQYGIAAGAILARSGPLAALTRLQDAPPVEKPTLHGRVLATMSRPGAAIAIVAACVLVLMFGPLGVTAARYAILKLRFNDLDQQLQSAHLARNQLSIYEELRKQNVWPMTKLLSDLATNTPLGIQLDTIRVEAGKEITVTGSATSYDGRSPAENFALMQENLRQDGLFHDIVVNIEKSGNMSGHKITLSAKVAKPYTAPTYPVARDFQAWTHADRRDGRTPGESSPAASAAARTDAPPAASDSSTPPAAAVAAANSDSTTTPRRPVPRVDRTMMGGDDVRDPTQASDDGVPGNRIVPPPLSKEQVESMSQDELQRAWLAVSNARMNKQLEKEVQDRLKDEYYMILNQLRKLKGT